jgi:transcriptional regulator with XRE-family HTH domain
MTTAEELRGALIVERHRQGLSQQQLGERIGRKTYNTIHQWERGVNEPNLTNFLEWAAGLGQSVALIPAGAA